MRADSPVVLVMKNWLPYSLSASRNTAGIFNRPFSSTFAGQLPRSFMRPAHPGPAFCEVKRENVVYHGQKCPLSPQIWVSVYYALQCPTTHYLALLLPTSYHFAPHDRLLSAHVKRNHAHFSKYVVKIF